MNRPYKIGYGYDSHRFLTDEEKKIIESKDFHEEKTEFYSKEKKLVIGGVTLEESEQKKYGPFKARSDGDVLYHSVVNALLSALGDKKARDIGTLFPNTDKANSNRNSSDFLKSAAELIQASNYELADLKVMVKGKPRLDWHLVEKNLLNFFKFQKLTPDIHVQATSGEEMDGAGKGLGVEVFSVSLLQLKTLDQSKFLA